LDLTRFFFDKRAAFRKSIVASEFFNRIGPVLPLSSSDGEEWLTY